MKTVIKLKNNKKNNILSTDKKNKSYEIFSTQGNIQPMSQQMKKSFQTKNGIVN